MKEEIVDSEEYTTDGGENEANETSITGKSIFNDYDWSVAGMVLTVLILLSSKSWKRATELVLIFWELLRRARPSFPPWSWWLWLLGLVTSGTAR